MLYVFNFLPHPQNLRNDNFIYRGSNRIDLSVPSRQILIAFMNLISKNGRKDLETRVCTGVLERCSSQEWKPGHFQVWFLQTKRSPFLCAHQRPILLGFPSWCPELGTCCFMCLPPHLHTFTFLFFDTHIWWNHPQ